MAELWHPQALRPDNLFASPAFIRLRNACQADYPNAARGGGPTFALGNALRSLGLPLRANPGEFGLHPQFEKRIRLTIAALCPHLVECELSGKMRAVTYSLVRIYG
jgi:hypothetical protein